MLSSLPHSCQTCEPDADGDSLDDASTAHGQHARGKGGGRKKMASGVCPGQVLKGRGQGITGVKESGS